MRQNRKAVVFTGEQRANKETVQFDGGNHARLWSRMRIKVDLFLQPLQPSELSERHHPLKGTPIVFPNEIRRGFSGRCPDPGKCAGCPMRRRF